MFESLIEALEYHAEHLPDNPEDWGFHHRLVISKFRSELKHTLEHIGFSPQQIDVILTELREDIFL